MGATPFTKLTTTKVTSTDGTEIHVDAKGDPSHPAIVFIHGFSMSGIAFDAIFDDPEWTKEAYLIRYDMRGHGRSGKPTEEAAWESKRLCEDFESVVTSLNISKPFVVGWSLGGTCVNLLPSFDANVSSRNLATPVFIPISYANSTATNITDILTFLPPSYLSGIIYVSALPYMGPVMAKVGLPHILQGLPSLVQTTDVSALLSAADNFVQSLTNLMKNPNYYSLYLSYLGHVMIQPREVTARLLARTQSEEGLLNAGLCHGLRLLVVVSKKDNMVNGAESVNAVEGWKELQVVELEEGDHMPWLSVPVEFRDSVLGWVRRSRA